MPRRGGLPKYQVVSAVLVVLLLAGCGTPLAHLSDRAHAATAADWQTVCRDTSGHAWEVTDESGDKAQVTYCGYVVSDSALGTLADSGNVYVDAVFMVTDHLSAGFDTNSIVADSRDGNYLYIGQCNGNAAASGCIRVASGGGAYYAINAAGTVISNEAEFPLANEASPVIIVMITQMPEGDSTGPMIFAVNSSSGGHGPNRVQLYSSGEQQLPINF